MLCLLLIDHTIYSMRGQGDIMNTFAFELYFPYCLRGNNHYENKLYKNN